MYDTSICLRPINDLLDESFFIPAYQRGYRWSERQVIDLLEDVMAFQASDENRIPDGFYCLQPIVVKERTDLSAWEVADGQQRLTTLLLILHHFNQRFTEEYQRPLYKIQFETRGVSQADLLNLTREQADENVDFYFLFMAKQAIEDWFTDKANLINDFESALLNRVKVIWYELPEIANAVDAFTRLNMGKIPLTNAELVRALFLRSKNVRQFSVGIEQLKIAQEWDLMEKTLQNDDFWYFLTQDRDRANRIELVFDLITEAAQEGNRPAKDDLSSFHHFSELLAGNRTTPAQLWDEVKNYYMILEEWYQEKDLFHLIGYLINEGDSILAIILLNKNLNKAAFRNTLKRRILDKIITIPNIERMNRDDLKISLLEYLENLEYGSTLTQIKSLLLLFNIASIIVNDKSIVRFRFDYFKKENWDIEHIRSVAFGRPNANIDKRSWLEVVCSYFEDTGDINDLLEQATEMLNEREYTTGDDFDTLYDDVLRHFEEHESNDAENGIGNLTLLDSGTNRGYKNAVFPIKRERLLKHDQAGTFIPLCTRNAFLKCYSKKVGRMLFWSVDDQDDYCGAIADTLTDFFIVKEDAV